jgi:hypothetical protein
MDREHIDKLINDIQQYLKDEDQKKEIKKTFQPPPAPEMKRSISFPRSIILELVLLLSATTTAILTITILALGIFGGKSTAVAGTMTLLAIGGCGIFFTAILISVWKRISLLTQIEENTRLILASKLETNVLLERLMHK